MEVASAFNPSTQEAEPGRFLSSRSDWSTERAPEQSGLHRETLSCKNKTKQNKQTNKQIIEYRTKQRVLKRWSINDWETHKEMFPIISLVIREIQIKTALRFHFKPVRMAKINKTNDSSCWRGCEERRTLIHWWWEYKLVQSLWKSVLQFRRKFGKDLAIPLFGI